MVVFLPAATKRQEWTLRRSLTKALHLEDVLDLIFHAEGLPGVNDTIIAHDFHNAFRSKSVTVSKFRNLN